MNEEMLRHLSAQELLDELKRTIGIVEHMIDEVWRPIPPPPTENGPLMEMGDFEIWARGTAMRKPEHVHQWQNWSALNCVQQCSICLEIRPIPVN
jgi:hypothetical protein